MRRILALIAALGAVIVLDAHAGTLNPIQPIMYQGEAICTAFSINQQKHLWMTADHCIVDVMEIGGGYGSEYWHDPTLDLAVIYTPDVSAPPLRVQRSAPRVGDQIKMVGFPLKFTVPFSVMGRIAVLSVDITDSDGDTFNRTVYDMTSCRGNSGSPVMNLDHELIGVVTTGLGSPCASMSAGVPWVTVVQTINRLK